MPQNGFGDLPVAGFVIDPVIILKGEERKSGNGYDQQVFYRPEMNRCDQNREDDDESGINELVGPARDIDRCEYQRADTGQEQGQPEVNQAMIKPDARSGRFFIAD